MTFLSKREDAVKSESLTLLHKLCVNQDVANLIMKEQNFQVLVEMSEESKSEEVRSTCFKVFGTLAGNESKQAVKQLFYKANIVKYLQQRLKAEQSEDV